MVLRFTTVEDKVYVYIIKLVTRDGFAIKQVCTTPEKAIEITRDAGYSYLPGGAERAVADPGSLAEQLGAGKEFYLSNTPDWTGDLVFVSRYVVV